MLFTAPPATGGGVQSSGAHARCCSSRRAPGLHLRATRFSQRMVARATPEPVATKVSASPAVLQPLAPVLVVWTLTALRSRPRRRNHRRSATRATQLRGQSWRSRAPARLWSARCAPSH